MSRAFSFAPRCPIAPLRAEVPQRASNLARLASSSSIPLRRHFAAKAKDETKEPIDAPRKEQEEEEFGYSGLGAITPGTPPRSAGEIDQLTCASFSVLHASAREPSISLCVT